VRRGDVRRFTLCTLTGSSTFSMIAYLFPGQGSQRVGMGYEWCAAYPSARDMFVQADHVLGFALSRVCFEGPATVLNDTLNAQPALLASSVAALRALEAVGAERPTYVAGHSMGEFSALVAAGALSFEDGLKLVRERGRVMKQAGDRRPGGMAAVLGLEREALEAICTTAVEESGEYVGIANDNCPGQIVISGALASLERAVALAEERGAKRVVRLAVSIAAHSPLMADAALEFRRVLETVTFREPVVPFVANTTARPLSDPEAIRRALEQQLTSPVRWTEAVRWMIGRGIKRFIEVGPGDVLVGLVRRIDRRVERLATDQALARDR